MAPKPVAKIPGKFKNLKSKFKRKPKPKTPTNSDQLDVIQLEVPQPSSYSKPNGAQNKPKQEKLKTPRLFTKLRRKKKQHHDPGVSLSIAHQMKTEAHKVRVKKRPWLRRKKADSDKKEEPKPTNEKPQKRRFWKKKNRPKEKPIFERVNSNHIEMEPLCCLSSCYIRAGANFVAMTEMALAALFAVCAVDFLRKQLWTSNIPISFPDVLKHSVCYWALLVFSLFVLAMACLLLFGVRHFSVIKLKIHLVLQVFLLLVSLSIVGFMITIAFLYKNAKLYFTDWTFAQSGSFAIFSFNMLFQLWAVMVVKDCMDYFRLIGTFLKMAS